MNKTILIPFLILFSCLTQGQVITNRSDYTEAYKQVMGEIERKNKLIELVKKSLQEGDMDKFEQYNCNANEYRYLKNYLKDYPKHYYDAIFADFDNITSSINYFQVRSELKKNGDISKLQFLSNHQHNIEIENHLFIDEFPELYLWSFNLFYYYGDVRNEFRITPIFVRINGKDKIINFF